MSAPILSPLFYLPSIQFFLLCHQTGSVCLEACETYQKASYRNRADVLTPHGPAQLSIPLKKGKHDRQPVREVRIAYDERWHRQHWHTIATVYGSAPYFHHFGSGLKSLYADPGEYLFDFNLRLLEWLIEKSKLPISVSLSDTYSAYPATDYRDLRRSLGARVSSVPPAQVSYYPQVFEDRNGFAPDLSFLDLLFCLGPGSADVLKSSKSTLL